MVTKIYISESFVKTFTKGKIFSVLFSTFIILIVFNGKLLKMGLSLFLSRSWPRRALSALLRSHGYWKMIFSLFQSFSVVIFPLTSTFTCIIDLNTFMQVSNVQHNIKIATVTFSLWIPKVGSFKIDWLSFSSAYWIIFDLGFHKLINIISKVHKEIFIA